jgi:hypothetical protein
MSSGLKIVIATSLLVWWTCTKDGLALESRFYDLKTDPAECEEIDEFCHNADKKLEFDKEGNLSICDLKYGHQNLTFEEISQVLRSEPQKRSLMIFFQSPYGLTKPAPP